MIRYFLHAAIHALNEGMYETWQFDYEGRIFSTPVSRCRSSSKAIEELEWVARARRQGRAHPSRAGARLPRHPLVRPAEFDPFWKRVVELDILVALHSSDSGYDEIANWWEGSDRRCCRSSRPRSACCRRGADRGRHRVVVAHGALPLPGAQDRGRRERRLVDRAAPAAMKDTYKKMPQDFPEEPVAAMRRNIYISPFWEEDYGHLANLLGEDHVLFGSDYPHPEGLEHPAA